MISKVANSSSHSLASGALVVVMLPRMEYLTKINSPTGGKLSGKLSNSHPREQFSTTMLILQTPNLRTGINSLTLISSQPLILPRVFNPTLSQLLRPSLLPS